MSGFVPAKPVTKVYFMVLYNQSTGWNHMQYQSSDHLTAVCYSWNHQADIDRSKYFADAKATRLHEKTNDNLYKFFNSEKRVAALGLPREMYMGDVIRYFLPDHTTRDYACQSEGWKLVFTGWWIAHEDDPSPYGWATHWGAERVGPLIMHGAGRKETP